MGLRCLDDIEAARVRLWPRAMAPLTPWAFLLPALLVTGLLVAGLVPLLGTKLRPLDRATFRLAEHYDLANYAALAARPVYGWIGLKTFAAAAIVTVITLVLAFPYAWTMVRTPSPARATQSRPSSPTPATNSAGFLKSVVLAKSS